MANVVIRQLEFEHPPDVVMTGSMFEGGAMLSNCAKPFMKAAPRLTYSPYHLSLVL
jgi:hypothetical protein